MALPSWLLVSVGGRRSQRPGPSPTLVSLGPSHHRRHKSRVSLRGPPCALGVSGIPLERCATGPLYLHDQMSTQKYAEYQLNPHAFKFHQSRGPLIWGTSPLTFIIKCQPKNMPNPWNDGYLVKKILPIIRVCDGDVFCKSACPNALDRPLLGLGHDIPNISGTPLGNGCGFTVVSYCQVRLSQNVSLKEMTLWAILISIEFI
jgi:hypothetical protein